MHAQRALTFARVTRAAFSSASRPFHTSVASRTDARPSPQSEVGTTLSPRWLSDLRSVAQSKLSRASESDEVESARRVLDQLDSRWLELSSGVEGFLTGPRWTGLDQHQIAWGEMDSMIGHVNNVVYNRFAESSRVNWVTSFSRAADEKDQSRWAELMTPRSIGLILKSITTDYKLPIVFPDAVTVVHKLLEKPTQDSTNIVMECVIYSHQHQRPAARCFEDIVVYDYRIGKKASLTPFMVDEFQKTFELQEAARAQALEDVHALQAELS